MKKSRGSNKSPENRSTDAMLIDLLERVKKLEAIAHKQGVLSKEQVIVTVNDYPQGSGGAC